MKHIWIRHIVSFIHCIVPLSIFEIGGFVRKRKFWGWGYEDEILSAEEEKNIDSRIAKTFQLDDFDTLPIPKAKDIDLPKSSVVAPSTLENIMSW